MKQKTLLNSSDILKKIYNSQKNNLLKIILESINTLKTNFENFRKNFITLKKE